MRAPHLVDDDAQVARRLGEHHAHRVAALHGEAVAGEEPLGVERGHGLERLRPLLGIALHLLRVAAVRRLPDDQVAGEEVAALRHPDPEGVVGLALARRV